MQWKKDKEWRGKGHGASALPLLPHSSPWPRKLVSEALASKRTKEKRWHIHYCMNFLFPVLSQLNSMLKSLNLLPTCLCLGFWMLLPDLTCIKYISSVSLQSPDFSYSLHFLGFPFPWHKQLSRCILSSILLWSQAHWLSHPLGSPKFLLDALFFIHTVTLDELTMWSCLLSGAK